MHDPNQRETMLKNMQEEMKDAEEQSKAPGQTDGAKATPTQLSDADFEDLKAKNRPQSRLFAPTGKIEPTALNNKRI